MFCLVRAVKDGKLCCALFGLMGWEVVFCSDWLD